jgi:beta-xylosidase
MRLPDMPLHDPWIVADANSRTYHLFTSNVRRMTGEQRAGTMVYKSKDLANWDGPWVVFTVPDGTWANPQHGAWAPEVHEYKGKFYLFVTLHNRDTIIAQPPDVWRINHWRGTTIAVADSLDGPFKLVKTDAPIPPEKLMTLDGTLYVDPSGRPWMVYCHEWIQVIDGAMEAIPLKADLSAADGEPIHLFKASDAPWLNEGLKPTMGQRHYVTDGCELFRTKTGTLLMLWSSYAPTSLGGKYMQTVARSRSGTLQGPWEQLAPLVGDDSGHGMLFRTFEGQLMMVLHQPFQNARGKLYEMEDTGDNLRVIRAREDLHGRP